MDVPILSMFCVQAPESWSIYTTGRASGVARNSFYDYFGWIMWDLAGHLGAFEGI